MRPLFLLLLVLCSSNVFAWTPAAEERIARKAAMLAPPDMKLLIDKYSVEYRDGLVQAALPDFEARHTYFVARGQGQLKSQIREEVQQAIRVLQERQPTALFVERLGRISHLVADANNPFHVADSDRRLAANQQDYERYMERRMGKFATVFYGLRTPFHLDSYLDESLRRSASYYPLLSSEYFRHGEHRTSAEFDDRSTAFGVAALTYSHAVSDLVNIYYYIWKEAGGDVRTESAMRQGNLFLKDLYDRTASDPIRIR